MTEKTVPGSCFCGAISFEIDLPTLFCGHCHCSMCRRPHGASFVTWTAVPPEQFRFTGGEALVQSYQSSEHGVRKFCKICGACWMVPMTARSRTSRCASDPCLRMAGPR